MNSIPRRILRLQQESPEGAGHDPDQPRGGGARPSGSAETAEEAGTGRARAGSGPGSDRQSSRRRREELQAISAADPRPRTRRRGRTGRHSGTSPLRSSHTLRTFTNTSKHTCLDSLNLKPPAPLYPLQDFKALYKYCIIIIILLRVLFSEY